MYPGVLGKSGDWVQLSWSGVSTPAKTDWVGIFLLASKDDKVDAAKHAPIKYQVKDLPSSAIYNSASTIDFDLCKQISL